MIQAVKEQKPSHQREGKTSGSGCCRSDLRVNHTLVESSAEKANVVGMMQNPSPLWILRAHSLSGSSHQAPETSKAGLLIPITQRKKVTARKKMIIWKTVGNFHWALTNLPSKALRTLHALSHLIHTNALWGRHYCYSHFTHREIKADLPDVQAHTHNHWLQLRLPKNHTMREWEAQEPSLGLLPPGSVLFPCRHSASLWSV